MERTECKLIGQVPPVVAEWQQVQCPDCKHYTCRGGCTNPDKAHCPHEHEPLPLRFVTDAEMAEEEIPVDAGPVGA